MSKKLALRLASVPAFVAATGGVAHAADPADALAAITSLTGGAAAYGPPLFGLAVAVVGIMIGIKWIKRARSAG